MPVKSITLEVELELVIDYLSGEHDTNPTIVAIRSFGIDITDAVPESKMRDIADDLYDLTDLGA